ncbi:uncharacterized protein L201_006658 [Kwoniella dendrophila CBS 6074]|uniref:Uncharacterized protein n=1 Tax=Kwoniella dendrophila CBS 6074 TaxID=1295534 RepID=A0AAX4K2B9_9TREE
MGVCYSTILSLGFKRVIIFITTNLFVRFHWESTMIPAPIIPVYPPSITRQIIVQPAPIPPPIIPYPSTISQTFVQPVQIPPPTNYPPQPQQIYNSPPQIPRYPSLQRQKHTNYLDSSQNQQLASLPVHIPRPESRTDRRYSTDQPPYNRDGRYSLEERRHSHQQAEHRRSITPSPRHTNRPGVHRSASTSQKLPVRIPHHHHHYHQAQNTTSNEEGDSGSVSEEHRKRYTRPIDQRAASTSAQANYHHQHHSPDPVYTSPNDRIPNPPRRSFDHSSREHLEFDNLHAHRHQYRSSSRQSNHRQHGSSGWHTRSSSISSNKPSIRGHGRTPSTDHLMVPERLDTLPQRKRKESLDTLRNQPISHPPTINNNNTSRQQIQHPIAKDMKTPIPPQKALPVKQSKELKTPKPIRKDLPTEQREERHDLMRKLSSTEILYPTPEAAKEAFRAERAMLPPTQHRRPPTPFTSSRRSSSIKKVDSDRSIRSRVSFDSTRSRGSNRSNRSRRSDFDDDFRSDYGDDMTNDWQASFGNNASIGPAGEAIEVIGLGRKTPRHRTFNVGMLKPALRSSSRVDSRAELRENLPGPGNQREKPLPSRPMSYVTPIVKNTIAKVTGPSTRKTLKRSSHQPTASTSSYSNAPGHSLLGASASVTSLNRTQSHSRSRHSRTNNSIGGGSGIRSLFSSLSLGLNHSNSTQNGLNESHQAASTINGSVNGSSSIAAPTRNTRQQLILPADDLYSYLHFAEVPSWSRWPLSGGSSKRGLGIWGGKRSLGFDEMAWEWHRRLQLAEEARINGRMLNSWKSHRGWERGIIDWLQENIPRHPIDIANRWGAQIFALPADGFDTLEFFDDSINQAEDLGLLSWITGTLLQTAVSALHMLRYTSSTFTFHLIPSPRPPHLQQPQPPHLMSEPPSSGSKSHFLWEGFGTMVLVNKVNDTDRAMILEVRPPSVVDSSVMKEFAKGKNGEGWWGSYSDTCIGEVGQANLLQAQVYDDCIQNQVYFFAVTNLKYWVFGQFASDYSRCAVSPVIHRQDSTPSLMQCLTAWVIRSVDERPRASDPHVNINPQLPTPPRDEPRERRKHRRPPQSHSHSQSTDTPSFSENTRSRRSNPGPSFSLPPNPQGYDYPTPYPQPNMSSTPVYPNNAQNVYSMNEFGNYGLPAYNDLPQNSMSPSPYNQPNPGMMYPQQWHTIDGSSRAFSPMPDHAHAGTPMPYNFGNTWYSGAGGGMFPWNGMR